MSYDGYDVVDTVMEIMCATCPNSSACHNSDLECNYEQMCICIKGLDRNRYPATFTPLCSNEGIFGEGVETPFNKTAYADAKPVTPILKTTRFECIEV